MLISSSNNSPAENRLMMMMMTSDSDKMVGTHSVTAPTTTTTTSSSAPFDVIVVTCPDERAAQAALEGPLAQLQLQYPTMYMTATCDPLGCRCGSGGGTLAAMDLIPCVESSRSLILHAGGDSSRAPTQMVLGKAWTTLPSSFSNNNDSNSSHRAAVAAASLEVDDHCNNINTTEPKSSPSFLSMNPTVWMLQQLMKRFPNLPPGSVIVVAADTILSLLSQSDKQQQQQQQLHNNKDDHCVLDILPNMMVVPTNVAVLGVAVPAPFTTAKNHGVFGLDRMEVMETGSAAGIYAVEEVWQKPSLDVLRTLVTSHVKTNKTTSNTNSYKEQQQEEEAWIDTGIVIFFPPAVQALHHLMKTVLNRCTKRGLEELYRRDRSSTTQKANGGGQSESTNHTILAEKDADLRVFAKQHALSVDLYTHLLQAFRDTSPSSTSSSLQSYLKSFCSTPVPPHVLQEIYQTLSVLPLHVMALPQGRFLHLGTTREYMDFLVVNTTATANTCTAAGILEQTREVQPTVSLRRDYVDEHEEPWGFKLGLIRRQGSLIQIPPPPLPFGGKNNSPTIAVAPTAVMVQSLIHLSHALDNTSIEKPVPATATHGDHQHCNGHSPNEQPGGQTTYTIGQGTVVEHCYLTLLDIPPSSNSSVHFKVGNNCLLSGLRGTWRWSDPPLIIPDDIVVQMIPLMPETDVSSATRRRRWVYMVLGVDDDIKKTPCPLLYGKRATSQVLQKLNLTTGDLWSPEDADSQDGTGCLWKARIHPILFQDEGAEVDLMYPSYFSWLEWLLSESTIEASPLVLESLERWRKAPRLSLSEIRNQSDALLEFQYRQNLTQRTIPQGIDQYWQTIVNTLEQRQHVPCCFQWVLDELAANPGQLLRAAPSADATENSVMYAVRHLDQVVRRGLASEASHEHWDVCGRTLMVTSALLDDLAAIAMGNDNRTSEGHANDGDRPMELPQYVSFQLNIMSSSYTSQATRLEAWDELVEIRNDWLEKQITSSTTTSSWVLRNVARTWELAASGMTQLCCNTIQNTTLFKTKTAGSSKSPSSLAPLLNQWAMASAPARIDLSGGWSDTPPICFEFGGSVTGVAVTVDGYKPLSCRCRISTAAPASSVTSSSTGGGGGIWLRAESRNLENGELISSAEVSLRHIADLHDFQNPAATCALIKCALVYYGLIPLEDIFNKDLQHADLQPYLNRFCLGEETGDDVRLEVVCTSLLPHGSGLGTSSILGGCIISAIGRCRGMPLSEQDLLQAVLSVEQLLTAGGGYQDQVNGLIGGLKMVSSARGKWPVELSIDRVDLPQSTITELNERLVLAFTGQTRLAKNILQNVLRRWARRTPEIVTTVRGLVQGAHDARQSLQDGSVTKLGACLSEYWTLKKQMAGKDSGVEPSHVQHVLQVLGDEIVGASLCGAGGGGFLVLLAREGGNLQTLRHAADQALPNQGDRLPGDDSMPQLTWHACQVSLQGLTTGVLSNVPVDADWDYFDLSWQSPEFGV